MEYVIPLDVMEPFFVEPGERGWLMEGFKHGLASTSVIITDTAPGGGPRLHAHATEEVHVLPRCRMRYVIGACRFEADGPCIVRIPAGMPHAFTNAGDEPVSLVCFFPDREIWASQVSLGPNPLLG